MIEKLMKAAHTFHLLERSLSTARKRRKIGLPSNNTISEFELLRRKGASKIDSHALLRMLRAPGVKIMPIHALLIKLGFQSVIFLQTSLLSMYAQVRKLSDARRLFDEIPHKTLVCWTAMMSGYLNNRRPGNALDLFREMQMEGIKPDHITLTICLSACADLGALDVGKWVHTYISRHGSSEDLILSNALLDMYGKCGDIRAARGVFESVQLRDVTTWTSMILCHAMHGEAEEALRLFEEMKSAHHRIAPNGVTFIGVLTACSHAGLVQEGQRHWESMERDHGLKPNIGHYGCMVDMLCRAGLLTKAHEFIKTMPILPNAVIWRMVLGACGIHGNVSLGALARRKLLELEPGYAGDYVAMSNVYAAKGLWGAKQGERRRMAQRKTPGCSLIEVGSGVHEFAAGDRRHSHNREIQQVLEGMVRNTEAPVSSESSIVWNTDEDHLF